MAFGFFAFIYFFVTNVDFLAWHASRLEFIMLGMLKLFLHAGHMKTDTVFVQADVKKAFSHAGHAYVENNNLIPGMTKIS